MSYYAKLAASYDRLANIYAAMVDFDIWFTLKGAPVVREAERLNAHHGRSISDRRTRGGKYYEKERERMRREFMHSSSPTP